MISKNKIKSIVALHQKKFRKEEGLFIAEGEKVVNDLLISGWKVISVIGVPEYLNEQKISSDIEVIDVTTAELGRISTLTSPNSVLAIAEMPNENKAIDFSGGLKLVLDNIKDPGNFGALLRIADWFGIDEVICSNDSVDCFNPKVVMASMGSLFRVNVVYTDLTSVFKENLAAQSLPVYGTLLSGENLFQMKNSNDGFIILGNESNGISKEIEGFITHAIHIPSFALNKNGQPDSLNVSIAAGIVCAQFRAASTNAPNDAPTDL